MLRFIFRNTTGSFFRTIGRIIAYIVLGFLISILLPKNTNAMALTHVELMDGDYKILRTLDSTQINDLTFATFPSTPVRRMRIYFSGLKVTAGYNYTAMIYFEARNSLVLPDSISGIYPYVNGVYQNDCSFTFYKKGSTSGSVAGSLYFDTEYEAYSNFNAKTSGYILFLEIDLGKVWEMRGFGVPINYLVANSSSTGGSSGGSSGGSDLGPQIENSTNFIIDNNNNNTNKITNEQKKTNDKLDKAEETRQGIWETIKSLPGKFLDMLKGLFIPDNFDFLDNFKESLENKLGFIAEVPLSVIDFILDLATASWEEFNSITLPSIEMFGVHFWNSQEISLQEAINIFRPYRYITDVICVILCVNTLRKWHDKFASGGADS